MMRRCSFASITPFLGSGCLQIGHGGLGWGVVFFWGGGGAAGARTPARRGAAGPPPYSQYFKEYIDRVGIDYRNFPEVVNNIRMGNGDPKNLYSKWLAENGLISGWLLILFVGFHLYCLHYASGDGIITYRNLLIALLAVNFAILFQFGSYAYLPLWFTFAMNAEMERVHLLPSKAR